jgi:hypothetical protein
MVQRGQHYREPFDPDRDFVVARSLRVQGQDLGPGDPVDKTKLSLPRRLRQLYDQRQINMADEPASRKPKGSVARYKPKRSVARFRPKRDLEDA